MATEWTCPGCGKKQFPSFEMNEKYQMIARCVKQGCGTMDASFGPEHMNVAAVCVEAGVPGQAGKMEFQDNPVELQAIKENAISYGKVQPVDERTARVAVAARATKGAAGVSVITRVADPSQPIDAIAVLRARRDFLEVEIARADVYRAELKTLRKMLAIATKAQQANIVATEIAEALAGNHAGTA
jgi:hypothetical protein